MPTDDSQILVVGQESTPASWLIAGNGQVTPKSVFAHYNGAGAASSFKPALKIISDGGETVGVYPCDLQIAAGGSADVSWFPGVTSGLTFPSSPGSILQVYGGMPPASDFTWTTNNVPQTTNYPTNTNFNKISGTSVLLMHIEGDFTTGPNTPDFLQLNFLIDGLLYIGVAHHAARALTFFSVDMSRIIGIDASGIDPLPAGNHTITTQVMNLIPQGGTGCVARTSNAWGLEIMEVEAPQ